jgi:DNA-binding NtrC family response regulator
MARFLVVDTDQITVDAIAKLLRQDGHDVQPFTREKDAVAALSRESFDVVVTDLDMPPTGGETVVRAARECSPSACLVVVTSRAGTHDKWTERGVCIVVERPIEYDHLASALAECHERGGRREGCYIQSQVERPQLTQLRLR